MLDFQPIRARKQAPSLVDQVVDAYARAIQSQVLRPGMAVPSVREFARTYQVSTFTVAGAYGRLVAQGWLVARPGAGYRVAARAQ
ncbi:GntR family transcriptional regulator, partial [Bordetella petrii]|uniref:GntR family transcriptional regulator n=1 Tax=Bordetella petrii TaxID=94624 RepID=UPI001E2EC7A4